ncbi:neuraminidase [Treponema zuelzerae]|uniref:Neuraminidase n=1 Tax=Teretinema zuelzerae TaxID=156 RepID=A0AAE3EGK9_9SPIR|nr:Ig-like domain-containing protein [Teretinema zuelzerae]MCD1654324.1 neuraminidase [Teretinema zuelzerae]
MEIVSHGEGIDMKKLALYLVVILFASANLTALGKRETVDTPVQSLDSWLESVDISESKPGKYNILVTAEDLAGNQGLAGPYNMYVDPESDLPVTRITNPLNGMRVPGNLNVVGTCIDDDAVSHVELLFDDNPEPVRAEGKEFWSYYLDTNQMYEGEHTITVYGVDVNGVQGRSQTVRWHLDRNQPETDVQNLAMGSLVAGKFTLSGVVADGNGIKELSYSLDQGDSFTEIPLKYNKKEFAWTFSLSIDSRDIPDGPAVCWFKARDLQGSTGIYTFLFFVDNTRPEVSFIAPEEGFAVNGVFSVAGFARDINGIESLSWSMGKETGAFELVKGNPYWIKEFDIRGSKEKAVTVTIDAVDVAGNKSSISRKIPVDSAADIPSISVESPAPGELLDGPLVFRGTAKDDDGISAVYVSVDKREPVRLDSVGAFGVEIDGLSTGKHSLEAWSEDANGVKSPVATIPFAVAGPAPVIELAAIDDPNAEIHPESGYALTGSISSEPGLSGASWRITGRDWVTVPLKPGASGAALRVPITPDFPYGALSLEVRAQDVHGRETSAILPFYVTNLGIPRDARPEFTDDTLASSGTVTIPAKGKEPSSTAEASIALERVLPADIPFEQGMLIELAGPGWPKERQQDSFLRVAIDSPVPATSVSWTINGSVPAKASVSKTPEGAQFALIPLKALISAEWKMLDITVAFKDLTEQRLSGVFCVVRPTPAQGVFDDEQFVWGTAARNSSDNILLFDGASVTGLYNGKPDRAAASVAFASESKTAEKGLVLSLSGNRVSVSGIADGEYQGVVLEITDTAGETFKTAPVTFIVDSGLPELSVDATARPVWLQNSLPLTVSASDGRGISAVEYSFDRGETWTAFAKMPFSGELDISALGEGKIELMVRAIDAVGRVSREWRIFRKDTVPPASEVVFPEPGDVVNGETRIAFRLADDGVVALAEYRAPGDRGKNDRTEWTPFDLTSMPNVMIGTLERPIEPGMEFRFTDEAGNIGPAGSYLFEIDAQADLPVVEVHVPAENEIIRKDFIISGVVYDDDQPAKVWYRIDNGEFTEVPIVNSYSIPVALKSLLDNEHTITLYAEDIHGVRGEEIVRNFRVSLEEPKAAVLAPSFETTNKGVIKITGTASDKNGIEKVEVSLDNGNTFNLANGAESWEYSFDTRVIQDGTHVVFVKVYDKYETTGLYSSLINIDNTAPSIRLELPLDGSRSSDVLFIAGQTMDNIHLNRLSVRINNIDPKQPTIPSALSEIFFESELIISRGIDISALPPGFYNLEVRGFDRADNITRVSRNFEVYRGTDRNRIEFLYPMNGEPVQGIFNIYGRVVSEDAVNSLLLYVDGTDVAVTDLNPSGYFKFTLSPEILEDGMHELQVQALAANDAIIKSSVQTIQYHAAGPWVTIDNLAMGDFAIERPWLMGTTGYSLTEEDVIALRAKDTTKEERKRLQAKTLEKVEISFDNGKTFVPTESGKRWRYRIETGDMVEGYHFLVVRSTMRSGEVVVTRSIIQIDKTMPSIRLISPGEGGRYNNELVFSGLSSDDVQLDSVMLSLRPGDKSAYAVPTFIQGLYFDWHFWGATFYDVGLGLTFFDDNVKLQAQFGQFTEEQRALFTGTPPRYGGNVMGIKLLANLAYVPLDYFFGPDFSWLSATASIGANFSQFSDTQSGKPQILSAVLGQFEFPRVTIPKRTTFRTFSFYTEAQFWFIPTDVDTSEVSVDSIVPHVTGGVRVNVF